MKQTKKQTKKQTTDRIIDNSSKLKKRIVKDLIDFSYSGTRTRINREMVEAVAYYMERWPADCPALQKRHTDLFCKWCGKLHKSTKCNEAQLEATQSVGKIAGSRWRLGFGGGEPITNLRTRGSQPPEFSG